MLAKKEILEIREHLERAQNPLFFFDNDQDGLSSFLLLRRCYDKGNGVPVKTSPLDKEYFRRIPEFNPDYIFILDQPTVSEEFFSLLRERNLPVVWIDHHKPEEGAVPEWVNYYNSLLNGKKGEPVTKICYEVTKRKEDMWIMVAGCIADKFFPSEYKEFSQNYPELSIKSRIPFKIFYDSEIGKISRMMGTGLKDRTSLVMRMIRFLLIVKTPYEVLEEKKENYDMHKRFHEINSKLSALFEKGKKSVSGNLLFFKYSGDTSMSADLSNKLNYTFPKKLVVVVYLKGARVNLSVRGKEAKKIVTKAIKGIDFATFGGHDEALGIQMNESDLMDFEKNLKLILDKKNS